MKKFIFLLIFLSLAFPCFAEKQFTLTSIDELFGRIHFNQSVPQEDGTIKYYIAVIAFQAKVKGEGIEMPSQVVIPLGALRSTKATPKEIYTAVKAKMGQDVADKIKEIYLNGINEDISQP